MSLNQSKSDNKTDQHFRKSGGGARNPNFSSGQHRPYFGGRGRGAPPSPAPGPGPTSNPRSSYKKSNNVQGGHSRGILSSANLSDPNSAIGAPNSNSRPDVQSNLQGSSNTSTPAPAPAPVPKPVDVSAQRSSRPLPRAPSSQSSPVTSDSTQPSTPAKGDEGKGFALQFGSLSPGFMNGMQVPARTYSAPPNLDEQKQDQARRDSVRGVPPAPLPSVPKQEVPKKDATPRQQPVSHDNHAESKPRRDVQVASSTSSSPPQTHKPSAVPMPGIAMSLPFHQPPVPMQFGPNPQIPSQGVAASSLQMPIQMPLQMGNPSQYPQQVFVSGIPHHIMQTQGIMHQGQNLGFNSQMGTQLPHQLGHLGMNIPNQFNQQQAAKFSSTRKTVKITHPDTHEELRLDNKDGSSSGSRPHHSGPLQSQSLSSYTQPHPVGYFPNSYNPGPPFFPAQGSLPLPSSQFPAGSQGPRFNYPVSQPPPLVTQSVANTVPVSISGSSSHSSSSDRNRAVQNAVPSTQPNLTPVNDKAASSDGEVRHSDAVSKVEPRKSLNQTSDPGVRKDVEVKVGSSSHHSKAPASVSADASAVVTSSAAQTGSPMDSTSVVGHEGAIKRENTADSTSIKEDVKVLSGKEGHPEPSYQVSGEAESTVLQASVDSCKVVASESAEESKLANITSGEDISSQAAVASPAITDAVDLRTGSSYFSDTDKDQHMPSQETITTESAIPKVEVNLEEARSDDSLKPEDALKKADVVMEVSTKEADSCTSLNEGENMGTQSSSLDYGSSNVSDGCSVSDSNSSLSVTNSLVDKDNKALEPTLSGNEAPSAPDDISNASAKYEGDTVGDTRPGSSSGTITTNSNKAAVEANKSKNNKGKKKLKEVLQKADALGTTSDIYMAYKGPEEKKETIAASEASPEESNSKEVSVDAKVEDCKEENTQKEQSKTELDDWEDAADISTPKLQSEAAHGGLLHHDEEGGAKKYSRDFLLTFAEQCVDLPDGFEVASDTEALMRVNVNVSTRGHEHPNSTARIIDRPGGLARGERRGNGTMDAERWNKQQPAPPYHLSGRDPGFDVGYGSNIMGFRPGLGPNHGVLRHPRAQGPVQHAGGVLMHHPLGFHGMQQNNNSDADRWQRAMNFNRGLMPAPVAPVPVMHRADRKYEVGKVTDEEQAKQRKLKGILNKLTPQNFEKLFEQVKEVNIDNVVTLTGVISQIFDKALMEPTFCEMYANFCYHLASELPDLSVDDEKITFKRLLLNKCQEEFERGEREEQEANEADDGEGEVKQSEEEREQKRLKVRRRMLGNIRLIGELYKKRMLTERIMHECIKKLLGQYQNPDEENIEALCKLMSTIGEMIDHPRAKEHMDAYFDIMGQLSANMKLSSRVRFMLRDAIDLRKNKWQQRRKVEGPKKIEEVHRDAAQERMGQTARLNRGPSMNSGAMRRGQPLDFGPRGSMLSSPVAPGGGFRGMVPQARGYGLQDERNVFDRTPSVPLPQRLSSDEPITLGPQGGLARGMAYGGQQPSIIPNSSLLDNSMPFGDPRRMGGGFNGGGMYGGGSREEHLMRGLNSERSGPSVSYDQSGSHDLNASSHRDLRFSDRNLERSRPKTPPVVRSRVEPPPPPQNISSDKVWPEERLRDKSIAAIREYYSAKDDKEVALCIKDLNAPSFYPTVVSIWVTDSFERKDMERELLAKLLVSLSKPREGMFSPAQLIEGFGSVLNNMEDTVNDAPRAPEYLGRIFGRVVLENVVPLKEVGQLIHQGGEEPGSLVEAGLAGDVLGSILETIKLEKGEGTLKEMRAASDIRLDDFRPPHPIKSRKLEMFM